GLLKFYLCRLAANRRGAQRASGQYGALSSEAIHHALVAGDDHFGVGDRGRAEHAAANFMLPSLLAAGQIDAVRAAVGRAEVDSSSRDHRRGIHLAAREKTPPLLSRRRIERVETTVGAKQHEVFPNRRRA